MHVSFHSRPENLKKSSPKKLVKSNKSISRNIFSPKSIFCNFKNGQKSIFDPGKSLKLSEIQFHEKKIIAFFSSTSFTMDVAKKMESLTLYNNGSADLPQQENNNEFVDLKDLKQAMSKAEEIQTVQQKLVAVQRQIANSSTKNGAPPKQLLLYLVR